MTQGRALGVSLALAALAGGLSVVQRLVVLPIYLTAPPSERWLALLNRVGAVVILPGKFIMYRFNPPEEHYFTTPSFLWAAVINFVLVFICAGLLAGAFRWGRKKNVGQDDFERDAAAATDIGDIAKWVERDTPAALESPSRRAFLIKATGAVGAAALVGLTAKQVLIAPNQLGIRRLTVPIKGLPESLNGLTIAQLTDIHHDEWISLHDVRRAVDMTNALKPDFVALTGDYVTANPALIGPAVRELQRLTPRIGLAACLGNHDWWTDVKETRRQFAMAQIPTIDNDRIFIGADRTLKRESDTGICIGAVGDLWEDTVLPGKAFHKVPEEMPRILLSHNPDVAEQGDVASGAHRVDLMLSGHTHGGQVRLPGLGAPMVPSAYGQKYAQGLVEGPGCRVQISAGVGLALLPVRFNVQPEIVMMTLVPA